MMEYRAQVLIAQSATVPSQQETSCNQSRVIDILWLFRIQLSE